MVLNNRNLDIRKNSPGIGGEFGGLLNSGNVLYGFGFGVCIQRDAAIAPLTLRG